MILTEKISGIIQEKSDSENLPFYIYQAERIRGNCKQFMSIPYTNKTIHFASMANVNPDFLRIVREEGLSAFVNSVGHARLLISTGYSGSDLVFTASGMDNETMAFVHESGAQVNLDSPSQLRRWKELFPGSPAGIRCNIGEMTDSRKTHAGWFIGKESRLGFNSAEIEVIKGDSVITGLHLYAGTDILDIDYFISCYRQLVKLAEYFPAITYLNLGGGFGIDEKGESCFNMEEYSVRVSDLMNEVSAKMGRPMKLILEPGRIIGGNAGYFVCRVTDIKKREGNIFVGVNASSVQFPRPLMYPDVARHPVAIIRDGRVIKDETLYKTSVYGCSTYSRDFLRTEAELPEAKEGDILVFGNAGSYSASSYLEFLGFPKPKEYFV